MIRSMIHSRSLKGFSNINNINTWMKLIYYQFINSAIKIFSIFSIRYWMFRQVRSTYFRFLLIATKDDRAKLFIFKQNSWLKATAPMWVKWFSIQIEFAFLENSWVVRLHFFFSFLVSLLESFHPICSALQFKLSEKINLL